MRRKRSDVIPGRRPKRAPSGAAVIHTGKTQAIERALFEEWAVTGYQSLSVEAIAKRAGVGKAALYRRWPSKSAMVVDIVTRLGTELIEAPDTGDIRTDIRSFLFQLRRILRHRLIGRILPDLHAEMPRNPEFAAAVRSSLQVVRRDKCKEMLARAIVRGDLPADLDLELAADLLGSMIYWRVIVTRQPARNAYLENLTELALRALRYHR